MRMFWFFCFICSVLLRKEAIQDLRVRCPTPLHSQASWKIKVRPKKEVGNLLVSGIKKWSRSKANSQVLEASWIFLQGLEPPTREHCQKNIFSYFKNKMLAKNNKPSSSKCGVYLLSPYWITSKAHSLLERSKHAIITLKTCQVLAKCWQHSKNR